MEPEELRELASKPMAPANKRVRLVVSDIEGCLNLDESTYDHEALSSIRLANQLARPDNPIPFITVCSGRQHGFVEAMVRMIGGRMPAIFENGCGLFFPNRSLYDEYEWHPSLAEPSARLNRDKIREAAGRICRRTGARRVIGKEVLVSLHPPSSMSVQELHEFVEKNLVEKGIAASVSNSASAVDIAPVGIDKGTGLQWLMQKVGEQFPLDTCNVTGIGDSRGDLAFLRLVGFPAVPANAAAEAKAVARYCSPESDGRGVADIMERCIGINRGIEMKEAWSVYG